MPSLRQYFETDCPQTVRVHAELPFRGEDIEVIIHYDFNAETAFVSCYVAGADRDLEYFRGLVLSLEYGKTAMKLGRRITLPAAKTFPGVMHIGTAGEFAITAQFFGDPEVVSTATIQASKRLFIYSETHLTDEQINAVKAEGRKRGHAVQFRSQRHADERAKHERPLAFISHDSRDKDPVARPIAVNLQAMMCPVWYDDFSLRVGDRLRESIERGLRECRKCVLVVSPSFLSNDGWTKVEFDAIFTRELLERSELILPIWYNVTKRNVFDYSPTLANIVALDWNKLGIEEVCRRLHRAITR